METLYQIFSSINFTPVLIHTFPMIVNPLSHGFQLLFGVLFTSLKNLITFHPGLISGVFMVSLGYIGYALIQRPVKQVVSIQGKENTFPGNEKVISQK